MKRSDLKISTVLLFVLFCGVAWVAFELREWVETVLYLDY